MQELIPEGIVFPSGAESELRYEDLARVRQAIIEHAQR